MYNRDVYTKLLEESRKTIVATLSPREEVERISLFGSYARAQADLFTDLDILIIMNTNLNFIERLRMLYSLLALPVDMDIICYTPQEFQALKDRPFLKQILHEEIVLYEKK